MKRKCPHCEVEFEATKHEEADGSYWYSGNHQCPKLEGSPHEALQKHYNQTK